MLSIQKTILLLSGMKNKNQEQPHMRIMSHGVGKTIAGEFEVNTRRNKGADFCILLTEKKEEGRGMLGGGYVIT